MRQRTCYIRLRARSIAGQQRSLIDEASVERGVSRYDLSDLKRRRGELDISTAAHTLDETARARFHNEDDSGVILQRVIRCLAPSFFDGGRPRHGHRMVARDK